MREFVSPTSRKPLVPQGSALVAEDGETFPVVDGIPRFVDSQNYASAFGLQWNTHAKTQLDSQTGTPISKPRLERCLGAPLTQVQGLNVLEVGCGAGRFTELLTKAGANVHAVDLSTAVEANYHNIGPRDNYTVAQADLRALPFAPETFDIVLCLGVLQHTPSPRRSIELLWRMVEPGGRLVIDHYTWELSLVTKLAPWYRQVLKRLPPKLAMKVTDGLVGLFFPLHWHVRNVRPAQMLLSRVSPCLVYFRLYPRLTKEQHREFCRLDTFDSLTDRYKWLRTKGQIQRALEKLGAQDIWVQRGGNGVEARCTKPPQVSV